MEIEMGQKLSGASGVLGHNPVRGPENLEGAWTEIIQMADRGCHNGQLSGSSLLGQSLRKLRQWTTSLCTGGDFTPMSSRSRILVPLIGILVITGCATLPSPRPEVQSLRMAARRAETDHRWQKAVRDRMALLRLEPARRAGGRSLLRATEDALMAGRVGEAHHLLRGPAARRVGPPLLFAALDSRLHHLLAQKRSALAQALLLSAPRPPSNLAPPFLAQEGLVWFANGAVRRGTLAFDARTRLLSQARDRLANQRLLWKALAKAVLQSIHPLGLPAKTHPIARGWIELANLYRSAWQNPALFPQALARWRTRYPHHPAETSVLPDLLHLLTRISAYPSRLAVLLPLAHRYASAGRAIEVGILASRFAANPSTIPPRIFFDNTGSHRSGLRQAYQKALSQKADWIIGPLLTPQVAELARLQPQVPVLALNNLPRAIPRPTAFHEFSLSPRDEIRQIARRLVLRKELFGAMLVPHGAWGRSLVSDLKTALRPAGGGLLSVVRYTPGRRSYAHDIRSLLRVNASVIREQALADTLGMRLEFVPEPRSDLRFILVAAAPLEAREILPELKYFGVNRVPVYGLSRDDVPKSRHPDLNGLHILAMPWLLDPGSTWHGVRQTIARLWPNRERHEARLVAFGFDAFRLIPWLRNLHGPLRIPLWGATGLLSTSRHGHIRRRLLWARFKNGRAVPDPVRKRPHP